MLGAASYQDMLMNMQRGLRFIEQEFGRDARPRVCYALCVIHCVLYTLSYTLCVVHCVLYTVSYTLCVVLYPIHCVLCSVELFALSFSRAVTLLRRLTATNVYTACTTYTVLCCVTHCYRHLQIACMRITNGTD